MGERKVALFLTKKPLEEIAAVEGQLGGAFRPFPLGSHLK